MNKFLLFFTLLFLFFAFFLNRHIPNSAHIYQDIDSKAYINNATNFYNNNSFVDPNNSAAIPYYSLGYAFFIALIYKIFGVNNLIVVLIQMLLALFTMFLIFRITKILFGIRAAELAFAFGCLNLGFIVFSQFVLTEILLSFLLILFVERLISFLKTNSFLILFQSGIILGLSITVKPAAIYFVAFVVLFLMFFVKNSWNKKFFAILCFCFAFYLPVASYMFFNKLQFGSFSIAPLGNEAVYFYLFPKVLVAKNHSDYSIEVKRISSLLTGDKLNPKSWEKVKDLFFEYFKKDPIIFLKIWMKNVLKTFCGLFTTNLKVLLEPYFRGGDVSFFKTYGTILQRVWDYISGGTDSFAIKIIGVLEATWSILRYFLIFIALAFLAIKKRWAEFFLFIAYIFYFSMITGHDGCARFRMMFEPVLIILTALGFEVIFFKNCGSKFC